MYRKTNSISSDLKLKVSHDIRRRILEITSLIRVMNNYYYKKNWINSIYNGIDPIKYNFLDKNDSFKFPDNILLFEYWMNLGFDALYPRVALHYVFPGLLKSEKTRNLFQFTFSTSRGFGFPIYFGPEFYGYILKYGKVLEPIFKWSHTVCHRANQAIYIVGNRFNIKRHHPGEFESAIISEYKNGIFKGIDTLLHGYFTIGPKTLGIYSSLDKALQNLAFSYSVGDHAINVEPKIPNKIKLIPLIDHHTIKEKYEVDFYSYTIQLFSFLKLLIKKIRHYKQQRKIYINKLKWFDKIKLRIDQSKNFSLPSLKISKRFMEIERYNQYIHLMEKLMKLIWNTPLFTHTIHSLTELETEYLDLKKYNPLNEITQDSIESVFLLYIKYKEGRNEFTFEEYEVIQKIKYLRDMMGKMWLTFKEEHFKYALNELKELSTLSLNDKNYKHETIKYVDKLIPIFSVYEIFNRPLSETIYPESIPQKRRIRVYIARFLTSRYNFFGVNLMRHFNNLAFNNWSYLIRKKKINLNQFFELILKLPIWKYIPLNIKKSIIQNLQKEIK